MQSETLARLGQFEDALAVHYQLRAVYVPELHSGRMCTIYGTDRAAQNVSLSVVWLNEVGNEKEAMEACDLVMNKLLPKMDIQNVHNSFVLVLPILWAMKDHGQSLMAYTICKERIVDPFDEYYGEGRSTPSRLFHKPLLMLFDLHGNREGKVESFEDYLSWALCVDNLRFGSLANVACMSFGRLADCVSSEICLLLAKRNECGKSTKKQLVASALGVCRDAVALATTKKSKPCVRSATDILSDLEELEAELDDSS
jgi:hypothetical protein